MESVFQTTEELNKTHENQATVSLILGIIGILISWMPILGIAGLTVSIIGLVKSNKARIFAQENAIQEKSINVAGKWCCIAGIILSGVFIVLYFIIIIIFLLAAVGLMQSSGRTIF